MPNREAERLGGEGRLAGPGVEPSSQGQEPFTPQVKYFRDSKRFAFPCSLDLAPCPLNLLLCLEILAVCVKVINSHK